MTKKLHYNYFIPIFLWKYETTNDTFYHFTDNSGDFWVDWKINKNEKEKMKESWKLYKKFHVLSNNYFGLFGRGTTVVRMYLQDKFPYQTTQIIPITKRKVKPIYLLFKVFIYPFPETTLLYISFKQNEIFKTILYDEEAKKDKELTRKFNFLPTKENKKVVWYNKYNPYLTKFFYVYEKEPNFRYWKPNGENICLPSNDSSGFKSLMDCTNSIMNGIKNKNVFVQTDSEPIYKISTAPKEIEIYEKNIPSVFELFLIFLVFFIFYCLKINDYR